MGTGNPEGGPQVPRINSGDGVGGPPRIRYPSSKGGLDQDVRILPQHGGNYPPLNKINNILDDCGEG